MLRWIAAAVHDYFVVEIPLWSKATTNGGQLTLEWKTFFILQLKLRVSSRIEASFELSQGTIDRLAQALSLLIEEADSQAQELIQLSDDYCLIVNKDGLTIAQLQAAGSAAEYTVKQWHLHSLLEELEEYVSTDNTQWVRSH